MGGDRNTQDQSLQQFIETTYVPQEHMLASLGWGTGVWVVLLLNMRIIAEAIQLTEENESCKLTSEGERKKVEFTTLTFEEI